jgi:hypothetical protein
MLSEFSRDIQRFLTEQSYPVRATFGYEQAVAGAHRGHFVIFEHDTAGDTLGPPTTGAKRNPRLVRARYLGCVAEIYAKSSLPGARRADHERECEKIVDALVCAFYRWGAEGQVGDLPWKSGKYVDGKDAPDRPREKWPGVCYQISFALPRGVYDRTYVAENNPGAPEPTGSAATVRNRTEARLEGGDPEAPPDIGCGS